MSVIVPVHNGENYLQETLASILAQTKAPLEVLLVDDGSTDRSALIAAEFAPTVRCIRQAHSGAAAARNRGLEEAKGAFIAFLDADDIWLPLKLERQLDALERCGPRTASFTYMEQFISAELPERDTVVARPVLPGASVCTLLIKTALFKEVGEFSTQFERGEFIDWYSRARDAGIEFDMIPEILARRRLHRNNMGRKDESGAEYAMIVKAALDRLRKRG